MRSFAFFALLLCSANVLAQTPTEQIAKLQKDPNVIWIGEIYRDYEDLDNIYEGRNIDRTKPDTLESGAILHSHKQSTTFLKLQNNNGGAFYWQHYLINQVIADEVKAFSDANLTKPLSVAEKSSWIINLDTIAVYDPEKKKFDTTVVKNALNPNDIYGYRLRQLVYYNAKENMYYNLPLSIAPLKKFKINEPEIASIFPLFWLPVVAAQQPIMPNNAANMPFVKSVKMHFPFADMQPLKESKPLAEVKQLWFDYIKKQKNNIFATGTMLEDNDNGKSLTPAEINRPFENRVDTMKMVDPVAMESKMIYTNRMAVDGKSLVDLRINQTIGWDSKKKAITISTHSLAPIVRVSDDKNNTLFIGPLFYLYPHRRFKTVPK